MPTTDLIETKFRLSLEQKHGLEKLGLVTLTDLLRYTPDSYRPPARLTVIKESQPDEFIEIRGQIIKQEVKRGWQRRIPIGTMTVADQSGKLKALWFHQPYLAKKFPLGALVRLRGKTTQRGQELTLVNPELEATDEVGGGDLWASEAATEPTALIPVYRETKGLSSRWFYHSIRKLLQTGVHQSLPDALPPEIVARYHLPPLPTALVWIHTPQKSADAEAARKRFAFEEVFLIQLEREQKRREYQQAPAARVVVEESAVTEFINDFPFTFTKAQRVAVDHILTDFNQPKPMLRLLEGDVGSGKTAVAATTAFAAVQAGFEVAYMAPTEILARQHFESFINYFRVHHVPVGLITGTECRKFPSKLNPRGHTNISRAQLLKWVANGEIPIVVGTHALISARGGQATTVRFKNLAYVIIDEQHRFGVMQRSALAKKGTAVVPHLLSMTATPIPRTLALTIYGDLDLTLLDELPAGRRPIVTKIIAETERNQTYQQIREQLEQGRQAYVICPRIDEPDPTKALALQTKSAKAEAKRLQEKVFPDFTVGLVHSKLPAKGGSASGGKDKETVMQQFASGEIDILVATSVVEVGVNVPNATIIVIEGAERFGLAQLHQLRGRVLRSSHQAYCYLFTNAKTKTPNKRLQALTQAKNGFELAELDLKLRGPGALSGAKQWGLSDLGMEALRNLKMVEAARTEAKKLLDHDPKLAHHPLLATQLTSQANKQLHFE